MDLHSGMPLWLINSGLPATYPKLRDSIKTEVVIIGGGISGALAAHFLMEEGIPCVLVDGRTIGFGSTCSSTSLLQYELDIPLHELAEQIGIDKAQKAYTLCSRAIDSLERITTEINFPHFEKRNSLYFAANKKDVTFIKKEFKARKNAGFNVQLLDAVEIKNSFDFKAPMAILSEQGATTDAYLFTHALLQYNIKKGLSVFDKTTVEKIKYSKNSVQLITDKGFNISAKYIVNATGYEIKEFIKKGIVQLHSTFAFASEQIQSPFPVWKNKTLIWNTAEPYLYMRLTNDNRVIVGGRDETFSNSGRRDKMIDKKTRLLKNDFSKLFPKIDIIPEYSWAGTFGSTKDALPYIGTYAKTPHTFYALGFGGNGITFSVIAAEIIRDMIKKKPNGNSALFAFDR